MSEEQNTKEIREVLEQYGVSYDSVLVEALRVASQNASNNSYAEGSKINELDEMLKVQCADGNWNYNPYMQGMANGMIFTRSLLTGEEPEYLNAPEKWLSECKKVTPLKSI